MAERGVLRDGPPQQIQDVGRAVLTTDARTAQFDYTVSEWLVGREVELTLAVVSEACPSTMR
jgi:hypothetical protein